MSSTGFGRTPLRRSCFWNCRVRGYLGENRFSVTLRARGLNLVGATKHLVGELHTLVRVLASGFNRLAFWN